MNQTPIRGVRTKPGTRGRPRRAPPGQMRLLQGPAWDDGCPRLPQAAPGCPYLSYESPRSLPGPVGPLYRGTEAWKGRSGPRSDLRGERRAETGAHTSASPRRRRDQYRPNLKRRGREGGHVIHQSLPEDRGRFSNSSCRAAAAGLSGDRRWRCRRRASGVFGSDLARKARARRLRSVRSDVMSSKSTNLKNRARFVVRYAFSHS